MVPQGVQSRPGTVRIIAGKWRRRRLTIGAAPNLRPTSDRIRETVFNWLGSALVGARCLDLFAGTGALGFEAASRGAAEVVMVERDRQVARILRAQRQDLDASGVEILESDALSCLTTTLAPFDVVFLDPPFGSDLLAQSIAALNAARLLKRGALIYLESREELTADDLPREWSLLRARRAGQVRYHLASCNTGT